MHAGEIEGRQVHGQLLRGPLAELHAAQLQRAVEQFHDLLLRIQIEFVPTAHGQSPIRKVGLDSVREIRRVFRQHDVLDHEFAGRPVGRRLQCAVPAELFTGLGDGGETVGRTRRTDGAELRDGEGQRAERGRKRRGPGGVGKTDRGVLDLEVADADGTGRRRGRRGRRVGRRCEALQDVGEIHRVVGPQRDVRLETVEGDLVQHPFAPE